MFISKLLHSFACELKFGLQVVMQFLHLVCIDYSLRGISKWALMEFKLFTVVSEER